MKLTICILLFPLLLIGCKQESNSIETNCLKSSAKGSYLILNEGNFNWGLGSLTLFRESDSTLVSDVFQCQNSEPAGNVLQSIYQKGEELFLVVNNSRKIEVLDADNLKRKRVITNLNSPRYVIESQQKLFVSDLYNNKIAVLGINETEPKRAIVTGGWTEKMFALNANTIATIRTFRMGQINRLPAAVLFLDSEMEIITDSVVVNNAIMDAFQLGNFLLCTTSNYEVPGSDSLLIFDINEKKLISSILLSGTKGRVGKLVYSNADKAIYYVKYDLFKISWSPISSIGIGKPEMVLPKQPGQEFYGLWAHPSMPLVTIMDAKDYTSQGEVLFFDTQNQVITNKIMAGVIPTTMYLVE